MSNAATKSGNNNCENEAIWCESESASKPQYCTEDHKLDCAQYNYYNLRSRTFPPPSDLPCDVELDTNIDEDANETLSDCSEA